MTSSPFSFIGLAVFAVVVCIIVVIEAPLVAEIGGAIVGGILLLTGIGYLIYNGGPAISRWWNYQTALRQARRIERRARREERRRQKEAQKEEQKRQKESQRILELERRRLESGFVAVEAIV